MNEVAMRLLRYCIVAGLVGLAALSRDAMGQSTQQGGVAGQTEAPRQAAAPPAVAAPLSTFVLTGPLQWLPPATFDAGPLGKLSVNGILTGFAQFQNNSVPGDDKRSEEHTSELQSRQYLVCRLLLEKKKK